ncbi:MAG: thioesterase family protein [Sneathiella sp.]|nr:thioesterase family protein [Sneathiella sp.]
MSRYFETYRSHVINAQLDLIGHMNIQFYHTAISVAMQGVFQQLGYTPEIIKEGRGFAAVDQHCQYRSELMPGDLIHMISGIKDYTPKSITVHHQLFNSAEEKLSFDCVMTALHFDMKERKVITFEQGTLDRLAELKLQDGEALHA